MISSTSFASPFAKMTGTSNSALPSDCRSERLRAGKLQPHLLRRRGSRRPLPRSSPPPPRGSSSRAGGCARCAASACGASFASTLPGDGDREIFDLYAGESSSGMPGAAAHRAGIRRSWYPAALPASSGHGALSLSSTAKGGPGGPLHDVAAERFLVAVRRGRCDASRRR